MNSSVVEGDHPGALPRRPSPVVHSDGSDDGDD